MFRGGHDEADGASGCSNRREDRYPIPHNGDDYRGINARLNQKSAQEASRNRMRTEFYIRGLLIVWVMPNFVIDQVYCMLNPQFRTRITIDRGHEGQRGPVMHNISLAGMSWLDCPTERDSAYCLFFWCSVNDVHPRRADTSRGGFHNASDMSTYKAGGRCQDSHRL